MCLALCLEGTLVVGDGLVVLLDACGEVGVVGNLGQHRVRILAVDGGGKVLQHRALGVNRGNLTCGVALLAECHACLSLEVGDVVGLAVFAQAVLYVAQLAVDHHQAVEDECLGLDGRLVFVLDHLAVVEIYKHLKDVAALIGIFCRYAEREN